MDGSLLGRRFEAQLNAMPGPRRGLIDGIGLSNITRDHLVRACGCRELGHVM
jgi:hypothetical protein